MHKHTFISAEQEGRRLYSSLCFLSVAERKKVIVCRGEVNVLNVTGWMVAQRFTVNLTIISPYLGVYVCVRWK